MLDIIILILGFEFQYILKTIIKNNKHDFANINLSLNFVRLVFEILITDIVIYYTFKKIFTDNFIFLISIFYLKHF